MNIIEYQDKYEDEWNNFVREHPNSRFVHLIGFKRLIEETFHYPSHYWLIKEKNRVLALFPCFSFREIFGDSKLISQPFSPCGGLLISPRISKTELVRLFEVFSRNIKSFLIDSNLKVLEIHNGLNLPEELLGHYFKKLFLYQYAVLRLDSIDNLWQKKLNYEVKKAIKKAQRNSIVIYHEINKEILENKFYPLYLISMKRLGSPPQSLEYFFNAFEYLKNNIEFFWAEFKGQPIAGLLGWKCGKAIQITDTVSDSKFWDKRANDLVCWGFIEWAVSEGFKHFDFGPVRYKGQARYKKKWGCDFFDYYYYYLLANQKFTIKKPLDETHPLIRKLSFLWQRIIPLKLTPWLGKSIRKCLGK